MPSWLEQSEEGIKVDWIEFGRAAKDGEVTYSNPTADPGLADADAVDWVAFGEDITHGKSHYVGGNGEQLLSDTTASIGAKPKSHNVDWAGGYRKAIESGKADYH
jgi:hypothetical protein